MDGQSYGGLEGHLPTNGMTFESLTPDQNLLPVSNQGPNLHNKYYE